MSATMPIKDKTALAEMKNYYLKRGDYRNHALIVIGLNTALRISDILKLRWEDVYHYQKKRFRQHIFLVEQKTKKKSVIALNPSARLALEWELEACTKDHCFPNPGDYIFTGRKHTSLPICRSQAYRIIKEAAAAAGLDEHISCHSLRKTFGYFAWQQGVSPVLLMNIYNHSSFQITKRYLCIEQEERDMVFLNIEL